MGSALPDAELLQASLTGSVDAFARLVERYQNLVCAVSFSATGDRSLSEDVAQDTFFAAWRDLGKLREPSKLRAWLCGIARNLSARAIRRRREVLDADGIERAEDDAASPYEEAINRESERLVWQALQRIPATYREPLVLYYREDQSVREVAAHLGLSDNAVEQRLSRGRRYLKEQIAGIVERTLQGSKPRGTFAAGVLVAIAGADAGIATAGSAVGAAQTSPSSTSVGGIGMSKILMAAALICTVGGGVAFLSLGTNPEVRGEEPTPVSGSTEAVGVALAGVEVASEIPMPLMSGGMTPPTPAPPLAMAAAPAAPAGSEGCGDGTAPGPDEADCECDPPAPLPPPDPELYELLPIEEGPTLGPPDAPVTMVVYADYRCEWCGKALAVIDELTEAYPESLRVVAKQFPVLGEASVLPARAALAAAEQGRFWEMHHVLYAHQDALDRASILGYAAGIGLDVARFESDLDSEAIAMAVEANRDEGFSMGIKGTPSFLINGERVVGVRPVAHFRTVIDRWLAKE